MHFVLLALIGRLKRQLDKIPVECASSVSTACSTAPRRFRLPVIFSYTAAVRFCCVVSRQPTLDLVSPAKGVFTKVTRMSTPALSVHWPSAKALCLLTLLQCITPYKPVVGFKAPCVCSVILILANVTAALMAMMIGAAAPSNSVANMAGSLAIMLFLLFGGFMLNKDQVCSWVAFYPRLLCCHEVGT